MTEPIKPKRRVTAQIPISSSPKLPPSSTASPTYTSSSRPAIRARVDPSSTSGSSTPTARPSLRPSQSTTSIRSSASLPAVPSLYSLPSRPRSPVRVKSPYLPPISGNGSTPSGSVPGVGVRAKVRASSPAQGGLASPLNQSYAQNSGTPVVRARVTNVSVTADGTGYGGRAKGFPSGTGDSPGVGLRGKDDGGIGAEVVRPKVAKTPTQAPLTPTIPHASGSRASSVVSGSSASATAAGAQIAPSPIYSPQLLPPTSPVYSHQHLQTPGAGPSSSTAQPINRRRSISPVGRVKLEDEPSYGPPPSSAILPNYRPYPLTPTLSPISSVAKANLYAQDPTASCPPSPHSGALPARALKGNGRRLPDHPYATRPPAAPIPPSPELKLVELPPLALSMSRDTENGDRRDSAIEGGITRRESAQSRYSADGQLIGLGLEVAPEISNGEADATDVRGTPQIVHGDGDTAPADHEAKDGDTSPGLELLDDEVRQPSGVVEEARINRKVADLEISNASLLAINRSLEISKSKQRAEILRLRRALRESLAGPIIPTLPGSSSASYFPSSSTPRSSTFPQSPFSRLYAQAPQSHADPDAEDEDDFDPGAEADLEERWAKLEGMMSAMQKRAEVAVRAVAEESRPAGRAVLGDWGDEEGEGDGTGTGGVGTPERHGEG